MSYQDRVSIKDWSSFADILAVLAVHMNSHPGDISSTENSFQYNGHAQEWTIELKSKLLGNGRFALDKNHKLQSLERCDVCQKYKATAQIVTIEEFRSICRACTLKAYKQFKGETNGNSNKGKENEGTEGAQETKRTKKDKAHKGNEAQQEDRMQSV